MNASGSRSARELARKLGLAGYDAPKRVERWLRGENTPRFDQTIELLRLAGLLNERRLVAAQASAAEALRAAEKIRLRRGARPQGAKGTG